MSSIVIYGADKPILRPFAEYGLGLLMVTQRIEGGNRIYFLDKVVNQGGPLYFPIVYALKEPIPFLILLLMVTLFISSVFGFNTGLDSFFIQEKAGAVNTVIPGRPSIPTMINFIVFALAGIATLSGFKKSLARPGSVILLIGGIAVLGYIFNLPILYYSIAGINTAMALNTAILFILIGIGFILCGKTALKQN